MGIATENGIRQISYSIFYYNISSFSCLQIPLISFQFSAFNSSLYKVKYLITNSTFLHVRSLLSSPECSRYTPRIRLLVSKKNRFHTNTLKYRLN